MPILNKNSLATKQHRLRFGVHGVLVGMPDVSVSALGVLIEVLGVLFGILDVFGIGMVYFFTSGIWYREFGIFIT